MNIREANQIIRLLNSIAEDVTRLSAVVEQTAWDGIEDHASATGQRPITAARLESPYLDEDILDTDIGEKEPATRSTVATTQPTDTKVPEQAAVLQPIEHVRGALADLSRQGLTDFIKTTIREYGHTKLSQLTLEQANAVLAAAEAEVEGGGA